MTNNLPPGVTNDMIPGNRYEDQEWDNVIDWIITETSITPRDLQCLVAKWEIDHGKL